MIKNFEELEKKIRKQTIKPIMAVVCAHDLYSIEAIKSVIDKDLIDIVLIGLKEEIITLLEKCDIDYNNVKIVDCDNDIDSAKEGVRLAKNGEVDALMKGKLSTKDFLKPVVDSENGIKDSEVLSHISLHELPNYNKIVAITDGGMIAYPDLNQKKAIVQNSVKLFNDLGYDNPKVAILAAVEVVNPKMQETIDADVIKNMNLPNCIVEGPISYDLAFSKKSAKLKGYKSEISGEADIMVMPNLAAGNIAGKVLVYSAKARMAGIVVGAKVPIVLTSRGAETEEKYYSIILSNLCNKRRRDS